MADVKISELNGATTPLSGTEVVPIVQGGETKKVAVSEIGGGANPTSGVIPVNQNGSLVDSVITESNGNVGIGTTSPGSKLEVNSGTTNTAAQFTSTDTGTTISLTDSIGTSNIEQNSNSLLIKSDPSNTVNNSDIRLQVDGSSKLTIKSDGNVGIGTTSPSEKLEVSGSIKANGYKSSDGSVGVTGTANASNTLTIKNGIITAVN